MRLWAALDTITFGEYAPRLGEIIEPSFRLAQDYVGGVRERKRRAFPVDLSALGQAAVVQVPELGRTYIALTGELSYDAGESREVWLVRSALDVRLNSPRKRTLGGAADLARAGVRRARRSARSRSRARSSGWTATP